MAMPNPPTQKFDNPTFGLKHMSTMQNHNKTIQGNKKGKKKELSLAFFTHQTQISE